MSGPWIETFTGKAFVLQEPSITTLDWHDVAGHLSLVNRFNGATGVHMADGERRLVAWSVAQHSLVCAGIARRMHRPKPQILGALLHDAHEAYLGDPTRPMKLAGLVGDEWGRAAGRIDDLIAELSGAVQPDCMRDIDNLALSCEAKVLMASGGKYWSTPCNEEMAEKHRNWVTRWVRTEAGREVSAVKRRFMEILRRYWSGMEELKP